jgi:uncharacterized membrane protein YfcA
VSSNRATSGGPQPSPGNGSHGPRTRYIADWLLGWPILLATSAVWFFFGARAMYRWGPDALGPAAGVMLAVAVGVTLWRWSMRDARREAIEAGVCPRCAAAIVAFEEPPRPGALARGLRGWRCANCGLEDVGPLTPARDAS